MTDTDRRTEPALTDEEWTELAFDDGSDDERHGTAIDAQGEPSILTVTPVVREPDGGWRVGLGGRQRVDIERRHALAALALYGQPYGFTPEDVEHLRVIADYFRTPGWDTADWAWLLEGLAARIAALLPPR